MKYQIVLRLLGIFLFLESVAMFACGGAGAVMSFLSSETLDDGGALFLSSGITFLAGFILFFFIGKKPDKLPKREGLVLVGMTWIIFGLFGALPFMLSEPRLSFQDAVFESVSGFTATGATIIQDLSLWPNSILLWRATSQWLGGLGILVLFMALLSSLGAGSKFLFKNESSFQLNEMSAVKIRDIALILLKLYVILTLSCTLGLHGLGMTWFESITHAFTAASTGGFSIYNESIGYFKHWETAWMIEIWLTIFMILSSLSFVFYLVIIRGNFRKARHMEEIPAYFILLAVGTLFLLFAEFSYLEQGDYLTWLRRSLFMVVSISTSTGYGLLEEREWPVYVTLLLTMLMLIGGCAGSTTGGIKMSRMILFWRKIKETMIKAFRPQKFVSQKINGTHLDEDAIEFIILFIALNLVLLICSTFLISLLEFKNEINFLTAFGAALATIANTGPGFGEVGLWGNFSGLTAPTKLFLSFLMILGRLELFTLLALLTPSTWRKF